MLGSYFRLFNKKGKSPRMKKRCNLESFDVSQENIAAAKLLFGSENN